MSTVIPDDKKLSIPNQIELTGEIWDSIVAEGQPIGLTDQQRAELRRRRAAHQSAPAEAVAWNEIRRTKSEE
ncbi:MAG: addiction module protein [Planctomycetaceae bacterium]|nr:addiction module protein [Planctomycetaceae bacterium]